jgi:hypothetical protein
MKHLSFGHLPGLVLVCILLLALEACKPDPEPKPDPCANYKQISAEFDMFENAYYDSVNIPVLDTIRLDLICKPRQRFDEYYWKVGTERNYRRDSILIVDFSGENWGRVPITFIGKRRPNHGCLPDEPETDTVTKYVYPIAYDEVPPIAGTYEGRDTGSPDVTYQIELRFSPSTREYWLKNIMNCGKEYDNYLVGGKGFELRGSAQYKCSIGHGIGYLTANDSLYLNFIRVDSVVKNSLDQYIPYTSRHCFRAKRIARQP